MSSYRYSQYSFTLTPAKPQKISRRCDFLKFLGIAQSLQIDFLPITWQQTEQNIGEGATGEIRESMLDASTSFAFKRYLFKAFFDVEELESKMLPTIVAELSVLNVQSIQNCRNIIDLVGISWEIHCESDCTISRDKPVDFSKAGVIPVLVFQKSEFGDLHTFMTNAAGKTLTFQERLYVCVGVVEATSKIHALDAVHGDIKPRNVLIFRDSTQVYFPRVTDFGFSTIYTSPEDLVQMPMSMHWVAPEWHHRGFSPAQAKKMDVFSLGMIVLWILCCNTTESTKFEPHVDLTGSSNDALEFVEEKLRLLQLDEKAGLKEFFRSSLSDNPDNRCAEVHTLKEMLLRERDSEPLGVKISLKGEYPDDITPEYLVTQNTVACTRDEIRQGFVTNAGLLSWIERHPGVNAFQLIPSMFQLYLGDYRVRTYIANCFQEVVSRSEMNGQNNLLSDTLLIQIAVCYEIGFGVGRDHEKSMNLIRRRGDLVIEVSRQLSELKENGIKRHYSNRIFDSGERSGHVQCIDLASGCGGETGWTRFQSEYKSEIEDIDQALGSKSMIGFFLRHQLARECCEFGQWQEAEKLQGEVLKATENISGANDIATMQAKITLADIYSNLSRLEEAQSLQMQIHEEWNESHVNLPIFWTNAHNLALTYARQMQWEKSDELLLRVIRHRNREHGPRHPHTLNSQLCLARNFADRGEFERAEQIETSVLYIAERTQGPDSVRAFNCIINLTTTYRDMGKIDKAKGLQIEALRRAELVLGTSHYFTLTLTNNLIETYQMLGQLPQAIKLQEEQVERMKGRSPMQPSSTVSDITNLTQMYMDNRQHEDAIRCTEQILTMMEEHSADFSHVDRLVHITSLLAMIWDVGKHDEALKMMLTALEKLKESKEGKDREHVDYLMTGMIQRLEARLTRGLDLEPLDLVSLIEECSV